MVTGFLVAWVLCFLAVQGAMTAAGAWLRRAGLDPRAPDPPVPVKHLRGLGTRLWAGGQPTATQYEALAAAGVTTVVDLREGRPLDPCLDDPVWLAALGMRHEHLPLRDGHAPDRALVARVVALVEDASGPVFVHCGGGVGRSGSVAAGWLAATGSRPSVAALVAVGPPTIEQVWYVARLRPGLVRRVPRAVGVLSRFVDRPRPFFAGARRRIIERAARVHEPERGSTVV